MKNDLQKLASRLIKAAEILTKVSEDLLMIEKEEKPKMARVIKRKHSDAAQDKKLINKIVDTKIKRAATSDKRQDAKMLKKVVKRK